MRRNSSKQRKWLPRLLCLESRLAPATFTVTNAGDLDGLGNLVLGSLRHRILQANSDPDADVINFDLPGPSYVINVTDVLPTVITTTTINGGSQPGFTGVPIVELRGAGNAATYPGLYLGNGSTVSNLIVNNFSNGTGVEMFGAGNTVINCYIGVDATGSIAMPNGGGIYMTDAEGCTITGNLVSGCRSQGIYLGSIGVGGNTITKNFVGTDVTGTMAIPNNTSTGSGAISVFGPNITIGGSTPELGNLVSGNSQPGIYATAGTGLVIQGNRVGTDVTGAKALPNIGGILLDNVPGAIVGGTTAAVRNLVSGNLGIGISVFNTSSGVMVQGNYVGVDGAGSAALGNSMAGIAFNNVSSSTIGGTAAGAGNVVSGNGGDGVQVFTAMSNKVQGNYIGTDAAGTAKFGNTGNGIFLLTSKGTTIGGTGGALNVIAANGSDGIFIGFNAPFGTNTIQGNNIGSGKTGSELFGNGKNGIEIAGSSGNLITGGNLIVNHGMSGIVLRGGTMSNTIRANSIGLNKLHGVFVTEGASKNTIGGIAAGDGNLILANGTDLKSHGVEIQSGTGNQIRRNSISDNTGRGIDLNDDWVTINDPNGENAADATKANKRQDYPVVIYRQQGAADFGFHTWKLNSTPNQTFTLEFFSNPSLDPAEYGQGEVFFLSSTVTTDAAGNATIGVSHTGRNGVTATATDMDGNTSEFSMVDTDADALADVWEIAGGLDIDQDGLLTANEKILTGAKRDHKDIFVEVDAMVGRVPEAVIFNPATLAKNGGVINAFATAPDSLVHNPDLLDGITLHAALDDIDIPLQAFPNTWIEFDQIKNVTVLNGGKAGAFGSKDQRLDANWVQIREALKLTYRYCMFADQYDTGGSSGLAEGTALNQPVNDFIVTIQPTFWVTADHPAPDAKDRAGTFMHELGHTLGLDHGGGDFDEYKPNYHSVMNYTWQIPNSLRRSELPGLADHKASWELDYSRVALPDLDETMLNEAAPGIGGHVGYMVPYGGKLAAGGAFRGKLGAENGAIDWDRNGNLDAGTVSKDTNFDGVISTQLKGHEDWSGLKFAFIESAEYADGQHGVGHANHLGVAPVPPTVESVVVNGGDVQRSRVTSIAMVFDQHLTISFSLADAFVLTRQGDGKQPTLVTSVDDSGATTVVTLTFLGTNAVDYGSLADGRYTLTIDASKVSNANGMLDGDINGVGGDNYTLIGTPANGLFRIFGDANGDGTVAAGDFIQFRLALGGSTAMFDFDGDGAVAASDFIQFRLRFGGSI